MFKFKIINKPNGLKINKTILDDIFRFSESEITNKQNWIINIVFENDEIIRFLNKEYRNIDNTTDVLSFHYHEDYDSLKKNDIAWEIILSIEKIKTQAKEYSNTPEEETYRLIIHSVLHLLWFDHEKDEEYALMQGYENAFIEKLNKDWKTNIKN